jgi:hypothetical protein
VIVGLFWKGLYTSLRCLDREFRNKKVLQHWLKFLFDFERRETCGKREIKTLKSVFLIFVK